MLKQLVVIGILSLVASSLYGQQPYELKVSSANDSYCLQLHDGYYTNGLFLGINYLPNHLNQRITQAGKLTKITSTYQLGQMIFTPELITESMVSRIDRPYAGYLFVQKGMTFFYKKGHVLNTNISIGTTGQASLAQQAQILIHKTFDLKMPQDWRYQVKNEVGLNLQVQYWHELMPASRPKKWFDIHSTSQLTVGNTFTNASAGVLFQVGLFDRVDRSSLYDARIDREHLPTRKAAELYFFFHPIYQYQLYNATV